MLPESARKFLRRYEVNKALTATFQSVLDDAYEFTRPLLKRSNEGSRNAALATSRLFDGTAADELQGFASRMLEAVWPANAAPFDLKAGRLVPPDQRSDVDRRLAEWAADFIDTVNNSDFREVAHECLMDWGIGTGCMLVEPGTDEEPLNHTQVPLSDAVFAMGPRGKTDGLYRCLVPRLADLPVEYPDAAFSAGLRQRMVESPDTECEVVEGTWRDWSDRGTERWRFMAVLTRPEQLVLSEGMWEGSGSCPFIAFHFTRRQREPIGRGPVQLLLPDIRTLNRLVELTLENADLAIGGLWQYDDDGTFNPDTITIAANTLIPRTPGTKGLEPLESPARFDVSNLVAEELRQRIRTGMFAPDLGSTERTPRTATEVMQRTVDRAQRMAGPAGRLMTEFLFPYVRRVAWIRQRQLGESLPRLDGRVVAILPRGPLTRAQAEDLVLRFDRYAQIMQARFGPQAAALAIDGEKSAEWLAENIGVPPMLVRNAVEKQALVQALAGLAQQATAAGVDVGGMVA